MFLYKLFEREITSPVSEKQSARSYEVDWNGTDYPSGVYFYKLDTEEFSNTKKMILLK